MKQNLVEHSASVTVNAPVHQVYSLFSHFNDFPKFMSFVQEVTYYDDQRSHWVANVAGHHEWDAVNEDWIPDQQIAWRSTSGLENSGRVQFQPVGPNQTHVEVSVNYNPPAGFLGDIGEHLGAGRRFDEALQKDLNNFAKMVDLCPVNAEDPNWSQYLFHQESAASKGQTTARQNETMGGPQAASQATGMSTPTAGQTIGEDRPTLDRDIIAEPDNVGLPDQSQAQTPGGSDYSTGTTSQIPPERIPPQQSGPESYPHQP